MSAREIANQLRARGIPVSRSAVIGLAHRKGLTQKRAATTGQKTSLRKKQRHKPLPPLPKDQPGPPPPPFQPRVVEIQPLHLTVMQINSKTCKYEVSEQGDPALFTFCGHESIGGTPYCADHCSIVYQPVGTRRGRARQAVAA